MAIPSVSASLNKLTFAPGEQMILTVSYGDVDNASVAVSIIVTDAAGNSSAPVSVLANISDPLTVAVTDDGGRVWTLQSDSGSVAVYRAIA